MVDLSDARCGFCRHTFWLCPPCDRGRLYCGPLCRAVARRACLRRANRLHRESPEGRLDHRDRQPAYRARQIDVLYERWVDHERSLGAMVTRTLGLLDAYGSAVLQKAVAEMIERGPHDPGALAILCEQQRHQSNAAPLVPHFAEHVRERDVLPHDLGDYDD